MLGSSLDPTVDLDAQGGLRRRHVAAAWAVVVSVLVLGIAAYARANLMVYGRFDDYLWAFDNAAGGASTHIQAWVDSGRLLPGVLAASLGSTPDSVGDLAWLRVIATLMLSLGAAGLGVTLLRVVGRTDVATVVLAVAASSFALSLPAVPSVATWAVLAGSSAAFPAAVAAGLVATLHRTPLAPWWVWSAALVLVSAFSYQHVAPVALLPILFWAASCWVKGGKWSLFRVAVVAGLVLVSLVANYVYLRLVQSSSLARVDGHTVAERMHWFFIEFLPRTVDLAVPWSLQSSFLSAIILAALLATPLLLGYRFLMLSAAVLIAWLLSALFVLPTELWASYRLISAAQFVVWGGAAMTLAFVLASLRPSVLRTVGICLTGAAAAASLLVAGTRAYRYIAVPNARDWAAAVCAVQDSEPLAPGSQIVLNPYSASVSPLLSYDEYGMISSSYEWSLPYMVVLAEREADPSSPVAEDAPTLLEVQPARGGEEGFVSWRACETP